MSGTSRGEEGMGAVRKDETRPWLDGIKLDALLETIEFGDAFFFVYQGNDYFVERGVDGYLIQDPRIGSEDDSTDVFHYIDYPGSKEAKTPDEFIKFPFLGGGSIVERFDELRFFDH
jgi:hypothetical protein